VVGGHGLSLSLYTDRGRSVSTTLRQPGLALRLDLWRCRWRVDPRGGRFIRRIRWFVDKAVWVFPECLIQHDMTCGMDRIGLSVVDLVWGHQTEPGMMMTLVAPIEEAPAKCFRILDTANPLGECRLVFQGLKWLSENGLSLDRVSLERANSPKHGLEISGWLCDRVTPGSASSSAVALTCIGPPRSADDAFSFARKTAEIAAEAAMDGIYVVRTSLPEETLRHADTVRRTATNPWPESSGRSSASIRSI
jgi:hypothetical protein